MADPLKALVEIISTQTEILQAAYARSGEETPSINAPFQPDNPLEFEDSITQARYLIVAAAKQLIATVQSPVDFLPIKVNGMYDTVAITFLIDVNVPEIMKETGPNGVHVNQLSTATGIDASYLARTLRYLAIRHIFKEISPNVFAHNRQSSLMTKAKSFKEIQEDPIARFDNAPMAAFLHMSEELLVASPAFTSFVKDPKQASAPFNVAYKTPKKMWDWLKEPGNEQRSRKFTVAMKSMGEAMYPSEIFTSGIEGDKLKPGNVVVDVGGNIGVVTLALRKAFPKLRYVVQDLEQQIVAGEKFWNDKYPDALKTGQVQLQSHDFFTPQPIKNAAVYFLRMIIHDWPDKEAREILAHLRTAAGADSKLIVFETLATHITEDTKGTGASSAPYPLLPNFGTEFFTALDLELLTMYDGKERTYEEYVQLGMDSGWKLEEVKPGKLATIVYSPI